MKQCIMFLIMIFMNFSLMSEEKIIVIGVQNYEEYLPYSQYKNREFSGFEREILDLFAENKGLKFEYKALPIRRLYMEFLHGQVDMKMPDNEYWSADIKEGKNIIYSKPIVEYIDGVMVKPENIIYGIDDLENMGVVLGFTPFAYSDLIEEGKINMHETRSLEGLLNQVILGRVDGGYINISVAEHYMKEWGENEKLLFNRNLPFTKSTRHLSTINHPELIDKFNEFLIKEKDKIDALKEKYKVEESVE